MLEDEEEEEEEKREEEEDGGGRGGWTNMPPAGAGVEFQGLTFCWARLFDRQKYHGGRHCQKLANEANKSEE